MALKFNGTNQALQSASTIDLTSASIVTLSFWLYWNAFANDDELALETSSNFNSNNGALLINPNSSSSSAFDVSVHATSGYTAAHFTRPSAATWHHYAVIFNVAAQPLVWVDGASQSMVAGTTNANTFGNFTLNLMSRNGTTLWAAGRLAEFAIFKRKLTTDEIQFLSQGNSPLALDAGNQLASAYTITAQVPEKDKSQNNIFMNFVGAPTVVDAAPALIKRPSFVKRFSASVSSNPVFSFYITLERLQ